MEFLQNWCHTTYSARHKVLLPQRKSSEHARAQVQTGKEWRQWVVQYFATEFTIIRLTTDDIFKFEIRNIPSMPLCLKHAWIKFLRMLWAQPDKIVRWISFRAVTVLITLNSQNSYILKRCTKIFFFQKISAWQFRQIIVLQNYVCWKKWRILSVYFEMFVRLVIFVSTRIYGI